METNTENWLDLWYHFWVLDLNPWYYTLIFCDSHKCTFFFLINIVVPIYIWTRTFINVWGLYIFLYHLCVCYIGSMDFFILLCAEFRAQAINGHLLSFSSIFYLLCWVLYVSQAVVMVCSAYWPWLYIQSKNVGHSVRIEFTNVTILHLINLLIITPSWYFIIIYLA